MKPLLKVLSSYRVFTFAFAAMLVVLLLRIPLGTFNDASVLDTIAHFVLPATAAPLIAVILQTYGALPELRKIAFLLVSAAMGIAAEVVWEIIEFVIDTRFNTTWQLSNTDTMTDLILAVIGALLGTLLFQGLYAIRPSRP